MGALRKTHGVSLDPKTLEEAKERAENLKISFSAYIYHLIKKDLREKGPLLIEPAEKNSQESVFKQA